MVSVFMTHGHVMVQQTVMMAQMKPIVLQILPVMPVNMIGHLMEPNAVIQHGMPLA